MLCTLCKHGMEAHFIYLCAYGVRVNELGVPECHRSNSEMALNGGLVFQDLMLELCRRCQRSE